MSVVDGVEDFSPAEFSRAEFSRAEFSRVECLPVAVAASGFSIGAFLRAIGRGLKSAFEAVAIARQMKVLSEMSNGQLARIGVARQDIPAYAEKLVRGEAA